MTAPLTTETKLCIGFGEFTGKCPNKRGSTHSRHWCQRCDDMRMKHITGQLGKIVTRFKGTGNG
jgi:hypothetical protein